MDELPMTFCWMGRPASELTRAELCEIILDLIRENERLRDQDMARSIAHIRDLTSIALRRAA